MTTGNKAFKVRHAWLEKKKGSNLQQKHVEILSCDEKVNTLITY